MKIGRWEYDAAFLYALRREVLRNSTRLGQHSPRQLLFLYALRREVLRNDALRERYGQSQEFLYALRREVLRNPTPVDGSLTSRYGRLLHARPARASTRSWNRCPERCLRR